MMLGRPEGCYNGLGKPADISAEGTRNAEVGERPADWCRDGSVRRRARPYAVGTEFEKTVGLPWLFKVRGPIEPPPEVAVVAIDGSTGRRLDLPRLPRDWPRTIHAQLIESLVERNAAVIVFDMDFSRVKSGYEDLVFAKAISDADRVVLFERLEGRRQPVERADGTSGGWTWVEEKLPPAPSLALAAKALGPFPLPKLGRTAVPVLGVQVECRQRADDRGDRPPALCSARL